MLLVNIFNKLLLIFVVTICTQAVPVPKSKKNAVDRILYDQRQEGEWNVRADLKNIVIMVIPTQGAISAAPSLLDFLAKSLPVRPAVKQSDDNLQLQQKTMHFIESKTAPYHVDITNVGKVHPVANTEEIILANPAKGRLAKAIVLTIPKEELDMVVPLKKKEHGNRKKLGGLKLKELPVAKTDLKLLGATEQCGPGLVRDSYGNCRVLYENV